MSDNDNMDGMFLGPFGINGMPEEAKAQIQKLMQPELKHQEMAATQDPSMFPASAKIEDDDCLLALSKLQVLAGRAKELARESKRIGRQIDQAKEDLGAVIEATYPAIYEKHNQTGWRKFNGDHYLVGWNCDTH